MSQPIQGDGGRLDELKAAAERVIAQVGADGLPPATRADAVALATFVRDLLALESTGRVKPHDFPTPGEPRVIQQFTGVEYVLPAAWGVRLAADLLRAADAAEDAR